MFVMLRLIPASFACSAASCFFVSAISASSAAVSLPRARSFSDSSFRFASCFCSVFSTFSIFSLSLSASFLSA